MSRIHVALILDDARWARAYAAMRSVCLSTTRQTDVTFHLFHRTMLAEHLFILHRISAEFGAELTLHELDSDSVFAWLLEQASRDGQAADLGFARLLFAEALPREAGRLVQIDCDMLVRAPVERLGEMDLLGRAIAAAADPHGQEIVAGRMMIDPRGLFDVGMRYFDAGLLVIDMERWRDLRLMEKFEEMLDSGRLQQLHSSGDFLNLALGGDWFELSQLWNLAAPRPEHEPLNPFVVSYSGRAKPWNPIGRTAYRRAYRHTMTNDVYYRYLAERLPKWAGPLVEWVQRRNG